ncbi:MAG: UDP-glucose/GDP-mannose dehydrogenase family protein [Magnetococcales bacterium]|nr:UDP-glucose/GDP-mannose dehydrogenase family protein [Magnetococcales bacterium]MBF0321919.1 UDP-glucose/GDP-mannose dehydrogenase family protein [Magnetococcales bacterium]
MRITMIGAGYVGLVSGACFSEFGVDVTCLDTDAEKIARLRQGRIPIYEPGLDRLVERNSQAGRLHFTTDAPTAIRESDVVFIAVGTPERGSDGAADLSYVYEAARTVARHLDKFTVVVTKSTVPVGTGMEVEKIILGENPRAEFAMASNPEFLREGSAIEDFMRPNRVVIGASDQRAIDMLKDLYRPLYLIETPILITNIPTAELTKYAANAFLATKIMFINQVANLCEKVGADVHGVARGMGLDQRIGKKFLHPGPGFGGSCFPKDTLALATTARENDEPITIVEAVIAANRHQKERMAKKIELAMEGQLRGATIAVLGLTFKPNTDDMRDAPSLTILPALLQAGARLRAYDPEGMGAARKYLPDIEYVDGVHEACRQADAILILTEWNQFRNLDLERIKAAMRPRTDGTHVFCDFRNIYEPDTMRRAGFRYVCVGR